MSGYIIITPAHNEAEFIEKTILSMVKQTLRPARWVIVNDGSTDGTADIVRRYCDEHRFIKLVNIEREPERSFSNKVFAFHRGLTEASDLSCKFIGNVDADLSFEPDYFESILREFEPDPKLGIAGGIIFTKVGNKFISDDKTLDSVAGAVQLFRRSCFDAIGGYVALPLGGIDAAAEIKARMNGWTVRKFPASRVYEHRRTGTATARPIASRIHEGRRFHSLGYSPLFYFLRCVSRLGDRPIILGSGAALAGYFISMLLRRPVALPQETVNYLRTEQRQKLKRSIGFSALRGFAQ
jgi:glycosyltransferase involved in cell wall biosynthesis